MNRIRTIIVDDEPLARQLIRNFLSRYKNFEIAGEADNGFEGIKIINELKPDLIFIDVQMPKISGLEMIDLLDDPMPYIIFSTAFDQYAVDAFEKNAIDYLLKPYNGDRFEKAIGKFLAEFMEKPAPHTDENIKNLINQGGKKTDKILVRHGSKIVVIPVEEIVYLMAEDDYVSFHTLTKKYLKQSTLTFFEETLPSEKFVRIHRSYIVNIDFLIQLEMYDRSAFTAVMKNQEKLPVSRSGSTRLKELLGD